MNHTSKAIAIIAIFLFVIVVAIAYLYQQRTYSFSSTGEGVYLSKNSLNLVLGAISTYVSYNMSQQAPTETFPGGYIFTNLSTMKSHLASERINENITAGWTTAADGQNKSSVYFVILRSADSSQLSQQLANGTYSTARQINSAGTSFDYRFWSGGLVQLHIYGKNSKWGDNWCDSGRISGSICCSRRFQTCKSLYV